MNKKSWTRILIVIVAGLWGYNIYRTIENYQMKTESDKGRERIPMSFAPVMFNKDTFELSLPDPDPFLKEQSTWKSTVTSSSTTHPQNVVPTPVIQTNPLPISVPWPKINYYGFLRNHEQDHKLCMLKVDGKNYRLATGAVQDNIKVIQAYKDSVIIEFNGSVKTFSK